MVTQNQMYRVKLATQLVVDRVNKIRSNLNRSEWKTEYKVKQFTASYAVPDEVKNAYNLAINEDMTALINDINILQQEALGNKVMVIPKLVS